MGACHRSKCETSRRRDIEIRGQNPGKGSKWGDGRQHALDAHALHGPHEMDADQQQDNRETRAHTSEQRMDSRWGQAMPRTLTLHMGTLAHCNATQGQNDAAGLLRHPFTPAKCDDLCVEACGKLCRHTHDVTCWTEPCKCRSRCHQDTRTTTRGGQMDGWANEWVGTRGETAAVMVSGCVSARSVQCCSVRFPSERGRVEVLREGRRERATDAGGGSGTHAS